MSRPSRRWRPYGHVLEDLALEPRLDQRAEREEVAARHQVDRCPHHRTADHLALLQQLDELGGLGSVQPCPQSDVRRERRLGLHADKVLDRLVRGRVVTFDQPLAVQRGAVQGLWFATSSWLDPLLGGA